MSNNLYKTSRSYIKSSDPSVNLVYVVDSYNPEQTLAEKLNEYLNKLGYSSIFPNFSSIRVGTIHPFALLLAQEVFSQSKKTDVFPSITVSDSSSEDDSQTLGESFEEIVIGAEGFAELDGYRQAGVIYASDDGWSKLKTKIGSDGFIVAHKWRYYSQHSFDFNIWSDNKAVTSFLFDMVRQFISSARRELHIANEYAIDLGNASGRRSGDINLDFGSLLYGANYTVQASTNHATMVFDISETKIASVNTQSLPTIHILNE
jgi:hypothetical protein